LLLEPVSNRISIHVDQRVANGEAGRCSDIVDLEVGGASHSNLVDVEQWRAAEEPQRSARDTHDEDGGSHSAPPTAALLAH
jgi:hypothetical protein